MPRLPHSAILLAVTLLAGCDMLGIDSPEKAAAAREAEGRAVGAACRHAGRALEDCYTLNRRVEKAAIFAGWRDMNDYMRENKIETVPPVLVAQSVKSAAEAKSGDAEPESSGKPADADTDKSSAKSSRTKDAKSGA